MQQRKTIAASCSPGASSPEAAEAILRDGMADLVGLARVLFADPLWPRKARGEIAEPIRLCTPPVRSARSG